MNTMIFCAGTSTSLSLSFNRCPSVPRRRRRRCRSAPYTTDTLLEKLGNNGISHVFL